MSAQDWYARKLGQQAPQQRAPESRGFQQNPYQSPPRQQPDYSTQMRRVDTPPDGPPPPGAVTTHNFVEMAGRWRGGQAAKTEKHPCPNCGGPNFFSRANATSRTGGSPAPHCYNCGYSGSADMSQVLVAGQGDISTWQAAAG